MQLNGGDAERSCQIDLLLLGVNEEAEAAAGFGEAVDRGPETGRIACEAEAALGGDLLSPLGDEGGLVRPESTCQGENVFAGREFEIECAHAFGQRHDVVVLNVPAVFAQVNGDAVSPTCFAFRRREDGIRFVCLACFANGRHVIDVHV